MVYRISAVSSRTVVKTVLISFFTKWCIFALICYIAFGANEASPLAPYCEWIVLGMALPAALMAMLHYRRIKENIQTYSNHFYTVTEGGVLLESGDRKMAFFLPWAEITKARRVMKHTIYLQHTNGKGINCLLEGLPEERIAEFAKFAAEHAGTTPPPSALTPPPTELLKIEPLRFSASPEQRREVEDARALLSGRPWVWTRVYPTLLLLFGALFVVYAGEARYLAMLLIACFVWKYADKLWRPGGAAEHLRHMRPARYHTADGQILIKTLNSDVWMLYRQISPKATYILPHGPCVEILDLILMVDPDQTLPPQLQAPAKRLPGLMPRTAIAATLVAILLCALYSFTLSDTWRLHRLINQPTPDIPTALSLAQLPPTTEVTNVESHYDEKVSILLHSIPDDYRYAAILSFELANGDMIYAFFDRYAKLVGRNVIPNAIDSDAAEYEEEAAASESASQDTES